MFAIAFDLVVADAEQHHPKGVAQTYADIKNTLAGFGFSWVQGSLYVNATEDLAKLFAAIIALKALPWLPAPCATFALSASNSGRISRSG